MKNKKMPLISVEFCMTSSSADLNRITNTLELIPMRTRKKRDWPQGTIDAGLACDLWEISTEQETSKSTDDQFRKMMSKLKGKEGCIKSLCKEYSMEVHFEIVIHMNCTETPEIYLEKESICFLAAIDADIGFDIYAYDKD